MATEAQTNANRVNSQKSTGPRTAEGKAAVSQNAVKHGLFAHEAVINGEDQADFDMYRDSFLAEMVPVGVMESMLAERIVSLAWRLRRTERMQNQAIDEMIEGLKPTPLQIHTRAMLPKFLRRAEENETIPEPRLALGRVAEKDWSSCRVLDRLMMYERRIESSMYRTMTKLKQLQIMRRIEQEGAVEKQQTGRSRSAAEHRGDLKKQSQFAPALMGTKSYARKDYDDKSRPDSRENKANQSQFKGSRDRAGRRKGVRQALSGSEVAGQMGP